MREWGVGGGVGLGLGGLGGLKRSVGNDVVE